jgi:hypothetical protein
METEKVLEKYERYIAIAAPKKGHIRVIRQTYFQRGRKKKHLRHELIKTVPITIEVPAEYFETEVTHFDNSAIQSSDRLWTETVKGKRYSQQVLKQLCDDALIGYEKGPRIIT